MSTFFLWTYVHYPWLSKSDNTNLFEYTTFSYVFIHHSFMRNIYVSGTILSSHFKIIFYVLLCSLPYTNIIEIMVHLPHPPTPRLFQWRYVVCPKYAQDFKNTIYIEIGLLDQQLWHEVSLLHGEIIVNIISPCNYDVVGVNFLKGEYELCL